MTSFFARAQRGEGLDVFHTRLRGFGHIDCHIVTIYSYKVDRAERLLEEARTNPGGISFRDFERLMVLKGWRFKRQRGSHRLWYSPAGHRLPIQPRGNKAKDYQVRQFLKQLEIEKAER